MMDEKQVNHSVNDALEAKFRESFRGYNQNDVDIFLDLVVEGYATFINEIDRLRNEVERLKKVKVIKKYYSITNPFNGVRFMERIEGNHKHEGNKFLVYKIQKDNVANPSYINRSEERRVGKESKAR